MTTQTITDQIQKTVSVTLSQISPFRLNSSPNYIALLLQFINCIARQAEEIELIIFHHLFSIPPDTIHFTERPFTTDILLHPFRRIENLVFFGSPQLGIISQPDCHAAHLHLSKFRPERFDIPCIRIILITRKGKDHFSYYLLTDAFPGIGMLINIMNGLQGTGDGAATSPSIDEYRIRTIIEQYSFNQLRPRSVLGNITVELDITDTHFRLQVFGSRIRRVVHFQIGIYFLVSFHGIVNETFIRIPTPAFHRSVVYAITGIFTSRHIPLRAVPVTFPMELAAGINQAFHTEIRTEKQETYQRVKVIKFRVTSNDDTRF